MKRQKIKQKRHSTKLSSIRKFVKSFPPYLIIIAFTLPALAAEGPGEKLAEGVEKTATGWVEVPKEMADTTEKTNLIEGVTIGTIKGAGETVMETTEGAVETATFFIPDEQPVPEEKEQDQPIEEE